MKTFYKIVISVFLFDILFYPFLYFVLLPHTDKLLANGMILIIRMLACGGIGFWAACRTPLPAADSKAKTKAVVISAAAFLFIVCYSFVFQGDILLADFVWYGTQTIEFNAFDHPVRLFFSENLFEQSAVASYMWLIIVFQLVRLRSVSKIERVGIV